MRTSETFIPKRKIKQEYLAASKDSCDRLVPPGGKLFSIPLAQLSVPCSNFPEARKRSNNHFNTKKAQLGSSSNYSDLEIILWV